MLYFCVASGISESPQKKAAGPDVILVTIDTLRADHVHCFGYQQIATPALDGLAEDGIRFTQAFTPSPITNTSHVSIMTGLLPSSHGVTDFGIPLGTSYSTWAELMKERGYQTAAFIGSVVLDSRSLAPGLDRGFDYYDNFPQNPNEKSRWDRLERRGMDVVGHAEAWLHAHPDGPHFLWVHLYDPHDPYEPPPPFLDRYRDRPYDGEIAYADSALAHLLNDLKKKGTYESALIIVTGDHGEGLGEHHEETHGTFLYDATTHVPFIMKLPGGAHRGQKIEAQVQTTDILPTALEMLGATVPTGLDGRSLAAYFSGTEPTDQYVLGETDYPLHFGWAPLQSVRANGFNLIAAPHSELYDLRNDPGEARNLLDAPDENTDSVRRSLSEIQTRKLPPFPPGDENLPDPKDRIEEANLLHRAMLAQEDARFDDAREALQKVLQLDSASWPALRQLGQIEEQAGAHAKAAEHLKAARNLRPQDPSIAYEEGCALAEAGNLAAAREALDASLRLAPQQFDARLLLGQTCLKVKDFACAADQFDAALLLQPEAVTAQMGLAEAEIGQGQFADAAEQLRQLSRAQPDNADALDLLARACLGLHKNAEAEQAQRRARAIRSRQTH
jgi:choline-sulfatase